MIHAAGGCLCGDVRYEATAQGTHPTVCHCRSCRRATGSPLVAWVTFPTSSFRFTTGRPTTFASSPGVRRGFCSRCGTPLTYEREDLPEEIDVTTATLDRPEEAAPVDDTWDEERLPWIEPSRTRPRFARRRDD